MTVDEFSRGIVVLRSFITGEKLCRHGKGFLLLKCIPFKIDHQQRKDCESKICNVSWDFQNSKQLKPVLINELKVLFIE